jgi:hypothetical protein
MKIKSALRWETIKSINMCGGNNLIQLKAKSFVQKRVILPLGVRICDFCEV